MPGTGRTLGGATSQDCGESPSIIYVAATVTQAFFIATIPTIIAGIVLRIRVGSTSGTAQIFKAPSGTAIGSGTAITASIDLSATPPADTAINVPLVSGPGLLLQPGDSIGVVIGGTMTNGVGIIQAFVEPAY